MGAYLDIRKLKWGLNWGGGGPGGDKILGVILGMSRGC